MIQLGPFVLETAIGRGGMAVVWRARHREQGTPVAIKILTNEAARNPLFFKTFRSEVRGVAGLDHPGIVAVFDHGLADAAAAEASQGQLLAGSPYLVMELAGRGTLAPHRGRLPWPELQGVLLGLLDALAHAHARGVIHRDLKPANVLVDRDSGEVKLTDFGLVHAFTVEGAGATGAEFIGTPAYMAPEQLEVRWRDFGPWTDLYALGCLGWALATGEPPFGVDMSVEQALTAHLRLTAPPLRPTNPVPAGFEDWLRRLLAREPRQRFQRAADAAWALAALAPPKRTRRALEESSPSVRPAEPCTIVVPGRAAPDSTDDAATTGAPTVGRLVAPKSSRALTAPGVGGPAVEGVRVRLPPLPPSWRRPVGHERATFLRGVGLGIYGVRSVPLVGREEERDVLWAALRATRERGSAQVVVLEGPAGCGKSRIARFVSERAHETGGASVLFATHGPGGGAGHGLSPMFSRFGRCEGLDRPAARRRVARLLAERGRFAADEIDAVTEIVRSATDAEARAGDRIVRFATPRERHVTMRALIEVLAAERPVLLVLDDLHCGADSIAFLLHLLREAPRPLPLCVLATVRDDALVERPVEAGLLRELVELPDAQLLPVGPLPEEHRGALVRGLLGLDGALAERVEERTAGNPAFAVQLVGDWVQRGLLELGSHGFRLRNGVEPPLPDDLHAVWRQRIERALEGRSKGDSVALELAATLGRAVNVAEWTQACGLAEVEPSRELLELLADQRLVLLPNADESSWSFVHAMLREALLRRSDEAGRAEEHHAVCANVLAGRPDDESLERRGRHLVLAGRPRAALEPLAAAVTGLLAAGELRRAEGLVTIYEGAVERLRRPAAHPAAVRARVLAAWVARLRGELAKARDLARSAVDGVAGMDSAEGRAVYRDALIELGNCCVHLGELSEARQHLEQGLELARGMPELSRVALCRRHLAYVRLSEGDVAGARDEAREAIFAAERGGDGVEVAQGYQLLSRCALVSGSLERAELFLEEARLRFDRAGARWGVATALNSLGELARERGEVDDAERWYRESRERYAALDSGDGVYPSINLGLLLVEQERWDDALDVLLPVRETVRKQRRGPMEAAIAVALLPCFAASAAWDEFDLQILRGRALLDETGFVETDIARKAGIAGRIAAQKGDAGRARAAYTLAREQWVALSRPDEARAVDAALAALPA